jgi:hypothetical protein
MSFVNVPAEILVAITDYLTLGELASIYGAFYGKGIEGKILTLQSEKQHIKREASFKQQGRTARYKIMQNVQLV